MKTKFNTSYKSKVGYGADTYLKTLTFSLNIEINGKPRDINVVTSDN